VFSDECPYFRCRHVIIEGWFAEGLSLIGAEESGESQLDTGAGGLGGFQEDESIAM